MSNATQDRKPLPRWRVTVNGHGVLRGMGVALHAWPDGVWQVRVNGPHLGRHGADNLLSAQLAAEDAAREMVAQMAAVLGLKVVDGNSPIPSPAVCEALARYAQALTVYLSGRPGSLEDGRWEAAYAALGMLNEALRAERDGEA